MCHPERSRNPSERRRAAGIKRRRSRTFGISLSFDDSLRWLTFYSARRALCKDISLEGCHLLGTRSQAPLPCCLILTARAPARSGFRLRIRFAQDDRLTDVYLLRAYHVFSKKSRVCRYTFLYFFEFLDKMCM